MSELCLNLTVLLEYTYYDECSIRVYQVHNKYGECSIRVITITVSVLLDYIDLY